MITVFFIILPFVVSKTINTNTIIESVVYLVTFGSTFGYFSIRSLKNLNKIKNKLFEGNYYVVEDIIEYIDFVFTVLKWSGIIKNIEPEKCSELIWHNTENLPCNIIDFEKYLLENDDILLSWGW